MSEVSYKRHLAKSFTWRAVGTLDTILLSWLITGNPLTGLKISWRIIGTLDTVVLSWLISGNPLTGLKIGGLEVITKMLLYYLHERTWYKINFGLSKRTRKTNG